LRVEDHKLRETENQEPRIRREPRRRRDRDKTSQKIGPRRRPESQTKARKPPEERSPQETGFGQKNPKDANRTIHTESVIYRSSRCYSANETESVVIPIDGGDGQKNPNRHSIHRVKSCENPGMNPVSLSPPSRTLVGLRRQGRRGIKQLQIHAKERVTEHRSREERVVERKQNPVSHRN
jgi:hypothetical protein